MSNPKTPRKRISTHLREEQYLALKEFIAQTTCRSTAEYARKVLLNKPVVLTYRNRSFDDLTEAFFQFKRDTDKILATGLFTEQEKHQLLQSLTNIKSAIVQIDEHVSKSKDDDQHL